MKKLIILLTLTSLTFISKAQEERKLIRQGNVSYQEKKYTEAEESYRKAVEKKPLSLEANYNIGNTLYKQGKYLDAASKYASLLNSTQDKNILSNIYYNMGNSYVKAKKLEEGIKAYKEALKLNPKDKETKYNLAYAQKLLMQQQQQKNNKDNKDNKKDKDKDKNNDKDKNKDQDKKDKQDKQDQQKQDQNQNQNNQKNISQEDANRILEAMQNEEKELQKKLKKEKMQQVRGKTLKNW